jgi:hypothetical protein
MVLLSEDLLLWLVSGTVEAVCFEFCPNVLAALTLRLKMCLEYFLLPVAMSISMSQWLRK